jgi:hypothetical protein
VTPASIRIVSASDSTSLSENRDRRKAPSGADPSRPDAAKSRPPGRSRTRTRFASGSVTVPQALPGSSTTVNARPPTCELPWFPGTTYDHRNEPINQPRARPCSRSMYWPRRSNPLRSHDDETQRTVISVTRPARKSLAADSSTYSHPLCRRHDAREAAISRARHSMHLSTHSPTGQWPWWVLQKVEPHVRHRPMASTPHGSPLTGDRHSAATQKLSWRASGRGNPPFGGSGQIQGRAGPEEHAGGGCAARRYPAPQAAPRPGGLEREPVSTLESTRLG